MKNFLRILIILLTILFFSLIVVSLEYASYKYSCYESETEVPGSLEEIKDDILVNAGKLTAISKRPNKLTYKMQNNKTLMSNNKNKYSLVNVTCNINAISDFLDKDAENEAFDNVLSLSKKDKSKLDGTSLVYNFDDKIGMKFTDGYLSCVEVYDSKYVFDCSFDLYDFDDIINEFGRGTYVSCNEGTFISYKMLYTYGANLVTFTSFYEDGRCNICTIENIEGIK
ncbi:MAG: hypothetical protein MJ246_04450 [Clostridia bacterium]|nr:hypothetical protein [Clostridia bacterium]